MTIRLAVTKLVNESWGGTIFAGEASDGRTFHVRIWSTTPVAVGDVFPFAWIGSLFSPEIAVYAVPNNGGWYDFGFFLGITVLGGGTISARSAAPTD